MNEIDMSILFDKYNEAFVVIKDRFDLLYKEFAVLGENNPIEFIKYRIKKPDSIAMKLVKKSLPFTTENIERGVNDIIGVRIVCSFLSDLETLKEVIRGMEKAGELTIINEKDYVNNPKKSGYSSYHMIVKIPVMIRDEVIGIKTEIQIRTIAMDMSASMEHKLMYKKEKTNSIYADYLNENFEICKRIDSELNEFIKESKNDLNDSVIDIPMFMRNSEYRQMKLKYEAALNKMKNKLNNLYVMYEKNGLVNPIEHIKLRLKEDESIVRKLMLNGRNVSLKNVQSFVNDIAGVRVVCSFLSDLEELKEIIKSDPELVVAKEKDYVNNPKDNGYRGYHLIVGVPVHLSNSFYLVKVEIQIRTIAMEMWASLEQKICYHKSPLEETKEELKRLSGIISIIDDKMNEIVDYSKQNSDVKKREKKKINN